MSTSLSHLGCPGRQLVGRLALALPALASVTGCYDAPSGPDLPDIVSVEFLDAIPAPADGASDVRILIQATSPDIGREKAITLRTTRGTFRSSGKSEVTATLDLLGEATVRLTAPSDTGEVELTIAVGGVVQRASVRFEQAWPEELSLRGDKFAIKASSTDVLTLTTELRRGIGVPTPGTRVRFTAKDDEGRDIGSFQAPTLSDAEGLVTARFVAGDTGYRGDIEFRAEVDVGIDLIASELRVRVIDP